MNYTLEKWLREHAYRYLVTAYQFGGSHYSGALTVEYGDAEGVLFFESEEELGEHLAAQLQEKAAVVKLAYRGDDRYFDFSGPVRRWLSEHAQEYDVTRYQYTYTQYAGEISLSY